MFYSCYSFATYGLLRFGSAEIARALAVGTTQQLVFKGFCPAPCPGSLFFNNTKAAAPRSAQYDGLWRTC